MVLIFNSPEVSVNETCEQSFLQNLILLTNSKGSKLRYENGSFQVVNVDFVGHTLLEEVVAARKSRERRKFFSSEMGTKCRQIREN